MVSEQAVLPQTPDPLCANYTKHLMCSARNGTIQKSHHWHRLSLKFGCTFVIEIQKHAKRIQLERICKAGRKLGRITTVVAYTSVTLKP